MAGLKAKITDWLEQALVKWWTSRSFHPLLLPPKTSPPARSFPLQSRGLVEALKEELTAAGLQKQKRQWHEGKEGGGRKIPRHADIGIWRISCISSEIPVKSPW